MSEFSFNNSSNFIYELSRKNEQIEDLIIENSQYSQLIQNLNSEIFSLKTKLSAFRNLSHQLESLQEKNSELEKKIEILSKEILMITKESKEEKRKIQNKFYSEIKKLTTGSSVAVTGALVESAGGKQKYEIKCLPPLNKKLELVLCVCVFLK